MLQLFKAIEESRKKFKELKNDGKNPMRGVKHPDKARQAHAKNTYFIANIY